MPGVEAMEPRLLLSVQPVFIGSVYIEEDLGNDLQGDTLELTFEGGAAGTQLDRVVINGDQNEPGFNVGDVFFDTVEDPAAPSYGADAAFPVTIVENHGVDEVTWRVQDGTTRVEFEFVGFDAGDRLIVTVDVDEVEDFSFAESDFELINDGFDPITSGVEFQGSTLFATLSAPHFEVAEATTTFRNRYDALLEETGLDLSPDNAGGKRDRTAGAVATTLQQPIPASIGGHVFHDRNQNGQRDAGEEGLAGVRIDAIPLDTVVEQSMVSVVTNEAGEYQIDGLAPGSYRLQEFQPNGYRDGLDQAGTVDGIPSGFAVNPGDLIDSIFLGGGSVGQDYDFGEYLPVSLSGQVHLSTSDGDCFSEHIEHAPIAGAVVMLQNSLGVTIAETTTNELGRYEFVDLAPGTYTVVELTPAGLIDGAANAGSVAGEKRGVVIDGGRITQIELVSGDIGVNYDFCETQPVSIQGHVHLSAPDGTCFEEAEGVRPLSDVIVRLHNEHGGVVAETLTDELGHYQFLDLAPGTYSVAEVTPDGLIEGGARVGSIGGGTIGQLDGPNRITDIVLGSGQNGVHYDFCEHEPARLAGFVYHDRNLNGDRDPTEEGIAGVEVRLRDQDGSIVATSVTDSRGAYRFEGLRAGVYTVVEQHPIAWLDGMDRAGQVAGVQVGRAVNPGDRIENVALRWGDEGVEYNFGEILPSGIYGSVHLSNDEGDCFTSIAEHRPLAGVTVELLDQNGLVLEQTLTDSVGEYAFEGLTPGVYSVRELTPPGLIDGGARAGTVNGIPSGLVRDANNVTDIVLLSGQSVLDVEFCEHEPASLSGYVYHDSDNDGVRLTDDQGIAGTQIQLLDSSGRLVQVTSTDQNGYYRFLGLHAGHYVIRESQPEGWLDGIDTAGQIEGQTNGIALNDELVQIDLGWGQSGVEYNFGELLPASIAGLVHVDLNADCVIQEDEERLADVRIDLIDEDGQIVATTLTDERGEFLFSGLRPGVYSLSETQPDGYFQGSQRAGTGGGDASEIDLISEIRIGSGNDWVDYAFCEEPPSTISGFVYQDGPDHQFEFRRIIARGPFHDSGWSIDRRRCATVGCGVGVA